MACFLSFSTVKNVLSRVTLVLLAASSCQCFWFGHHLCLISWIWLLWYQSWRHTCNRWGSFFSFFSFFFLATPRYMEFPGQGSDPNRNCRLRHSCGNTGSLTHCARSGVEPASQRSQDAANPVTPQRELHKWGSWWSLSQPFRRERP